MVRIVLVQPGATDLDDQGRIKGSLDIPLSVTGAEQVARTVRELAAAPIEAIYAAKCQSALQTAEALARDRGLKVKVVAQLQNLNHGLWHGKLIDEVRQTQPRTYRHCREFPELVCPPEGESVQAARERARRAVTKLLKRHRAGTIALVVPEPMASVVRGLLQADEPLDDLWQAETDTADWKMLEMHPPGHRAAEPVPVWLPDQSREPRAET
ncbi:MAG: histidine phosphatase family protein [Pirellulaceae bacterium]|jgi:broad specificity phosphatase PhoE|nr:histidine phosphatase family protein [Pirellulaceae bacterium]